MQFIVLFLKFRGFLLFLVILELFTFNVYAFLDVIITLLGLRTFHYALCNWLLNFIIINMTSINRFLYTILIYVILMTMTQPAFGLKSLRLFNIVYITLFFNIVSLTWRLHSNFRLFFMFSIFGRCSYLLMLNHNWFIDNLLNIFQNLFSLFIALS